MTLGYVRALDHGLRAVRREGGSQHLTLDLIRQLHRVLMSGADYRHPEGPGTWREGQNWIGARRIEDATLIPPPVSHLETCLLDLEDFLRASGRGREPGLGRGGGLGVIDTKSHVGPYLPAGR